MMSQPEKLKPPDVSTLSQANTTTGSPTLPEGCIALGWRQARFPQHETAKPRVVTQVPTQLLVAMRAVWRGEKPWPLVILGDAGAGKTRAGLLMLDYINGTFYMQCTVWVARVRSAMMGTLTTSPAYPPYSIREMELWQAWTRPELAMLDDIGTREKVTDHHYETVKRCLDDREGKATIYTSNLDLGALEKCYDDRVASRLVAGTIVNVRGDQRRDAARERFEPLKREEPNASQTV